MHPDIDKTADQGDKDANQVQNDDKEKKEQPRQEQRKKENKRGYRGWQKPIQKFLPKVLSSGKLVTYSGSKSYVESTGGENKAEHSNPNGDEGNKTKNQDLVVSTNKFDVLSIINEEEESSKFNNAAEVVISNVENVIQESVEDQVVSISERSLAGTDEQKKEGGDTESSPSNITEVVEKEAIQNVSGPSEVENGKVFQEGEDIAQLGCKDSTDEGEDDITKEASEINQLPIAKEDSGVILPICHEDQDVMESSGLDIVLYQENENEEMSNDPVVMDECSKTAHIPNEGKEIIGLENSIHEDHIVDNARLKDEVLDEETVDAEKESIVNTEDEKKNSQSSQLEDAYSKGKNSDLSRIEEEDVLRHKTDISKATDVIHKEVNTYKKGKKTRKGG
ncbi:uncharacterized protein LOC132644004 [Lycium barbarum]|uniref:uncharacterized protein LOC132644004 n=1 Tax=Lycium barbarum TaxID=112863 RepID=UPI00293E5D6B|nr:uncharacterized protein LOC132644004 [Lycium barbarum]